jgi:hypothetical protein
MNTDDRSLSSLYRRFAAARPPMGEGAGEIAVVMGGESLGAERQAALAQALGDSPAHARLAGMLDALRAESRVLAADVAAVRAPRLAHPARLRPARTAAAAPRRPRHHVRWAGALAAGLALALGIGTWQQQREAVPTGARVTRPAALPDRIFVSNDKIFAALDAPAQRPAPARDRLFRSNFSPSRG